MYRDIDRRWLRVVEMAAVLLALVGTAALPSASVRAYSGLQVSRDESDSCCNDYYLGPYPAIRGTESSFNGYDSNSQYFNPGYGSWFEWYSDPYPSPTYECPVVHVPDVSEAQNYLSFTGYHPSQGTAEANQVDEAFAHNWWVHIPSANWYNGDYLRTSDTGDAAGGYLWAIDVVEFHYDSNHQTCSY